MRIALRTGGGRGVYELAGTQGRFSASDLFDHEISYEFTPDIVIPGRSIAALRQGKPRIALDEASRNRTTHLYRLLSAVLLLPKPKREFRTTRGGELFRYESYSMTAIKVDVARLNESSVILRPTDLLLEVADGKRETMDFTKRMLRIIKVWDQAQRDGSALGALIRNWADAVGASDPDYKVIEKSAQEISKALRTDKDPLPQIERQLSISQDDEHGSDRLSPELASEAEFGLEDDISPDEALIRRIKVWRQQAQRGAAGRRFSRDVSEAYNYRCLLSGHRLPRLEVTDSPGVDSAHILPWSTHDLNSVRNGICLSKQCHWAFDQGILQLTFDRNVNKYVIGIPQKVKLAARRAFFDLAHFESMIGPVPEERLPRDRSNWPSPVYLDELSRCLARD